MRVDDVIDKLVEKFQGDQALAEVFTYHKVNGMLPDIGASISIGCDKVKYNDYSSTKDEAVADLNIFLYTQEADPELGERNVRNLAENTRYILTEDQSLGGLLSSGTIEEIEYIYADADAAMVLHAAVIHYKAVFYQERRRSKEPAAPVGEMNTSLERSE